MSNVVVNRSAAGTGGMPAPAVSVSARGWAVSAVRERAEVVLARPWPVEPARAVWVVELDRRALVLGSTQADLICDRRRLERAGVELVRRRSGGGAVMVVPGGIVWIDLFVPYGDRLWSGDVIAASAWLGACWVRALEALDIDADIHRGPPANSAWSPLICFAGLGSGEVTVGGRKVVGVSQRRTRAGALFQCGALLRWDPGALLDLLDMTDVERARADVELGELATGLDRSAVAVTESFLEALGSV